MNISAIFSDLDNQNNLEEQHFFRCSSEIEPGLRIELLGDIDNNQDEESIDSVLDSALENMNSEALFINMETSENRNSEDLFIDIEAFDMSGGYDDSFTECAVSDETEEYFFPMDEDLQDIEENTIHYNIF